MSDITPEAREAAEQFRSVRVPEHRWDRDTRTHEMLERIIQEAITRATAAAQERIEALERERDSAVLSTHRQAMCINDCAVHIGPETSATIKGLPKAVKHLAAERDSLRAELEKAKRERDEVQSQFSLTCAQVVALASKLSKYERPEELCEQVSKAQEQIEAVPNRIADLERELEEAREENKRLNCVDVPQWVLELSPNGVPACQILPLPDKVRMTQDVFLPWSSNLLRHVANERDSLQQQVTTLEHELAGARRQTEMDTVRFAEMQQSGAELEVANAALQQQVAALRDALKAADYMVLTYCDPNSEPTIRHFYGDHACKECHPQSEVLRPGFQCAYHQALARKNASTPEDAR